MLTGLLDYSHDYRCAVMEQVTHKHRTLARHRSTNNSIHGLDIVIYLNTKRSYEAVQKIPALGRIIQIQTQLTLLQQIAQSPFTLSVAGLSDPLVLVTRTSIVIRFLRKRLVKGGSSTHCRRSTFISGCSIVPRNYRHSRCSSPNTAYFTSCRSIPV